MRTEAVGPLGLFGEDVLDGLHRVESWRRLGRDRLQHGGEVFARIAVEWGEDLAAGFGEGDVPLSPVGGGAFARQETPLLEFEEDAAEVSASSRGRGQSRRRSGPGGGRLVEHAHLGEEKGLSRWWSERRPIWRV